ncbi:MAG TPA: hypothetical protein VMM13_00040 [Euzebya sp.]|nr:hypothetical protein [Euzebya sp.]
MLFHLIDRIDHWEPKASVRGTKLTSLSETYWQDGPAGLHMPRSLVVEAVCQAATWLVMLSTQTTKRAALLSIGSVEWSGDVGPGAVMDLDATVESMSEEMAVMSGTAAVDGRTIMTAADIMCVLIDAGDLEDVEDTDRMRLRLDRSGR